MAQPFQQQTGVMCAGTETPSSTFVLRVPYAGGPLRVDPAFVAAFETALAQLTAGATRQPDLLAELAANAIADDARLSIDGALWLADALRQAGRPDLAAGIEADKARHNAGSTQPAPAAPSRGVPPGARMAFGGYGTRAPSAGCGGSAP